jgi:hypothetical protein
MPFPALNPFLEAQALIRFMEGQIETLTFDLHGDRQHVEGTLDLAYAGMKLAKLENFKRFVDKNPKNGLLVSLVNFIIPKNHGPDIDPRAYQQGLIYLEHDQERDFIHLLVSGLSAGVISTMGFGPKDPVKALEHQKMRNARKAEKAARRAERERQRAAKRKTREQKKQEKRKKNG